MNAKKKIEKLADHYKVKKDGKSANEIWSEIKKVSGKSFASIDALYQEVIEKKGEVAKPVEAAKPADKPKEGEVLPPQKSELKIDGATQKVDVAAPALNFNLAPASVVVNPGNVSWAYSLQRAVMHAFVFGSGTMFGILVALAKLKGAV